MVLQLLHEVLKQHFVISFVYQNIANLLKYLKRIFFAQNSNNAKMADLKLHVWPTKSY